MKEIILGIAASIFFAVTFILNRSMDLAGGSWIWSSSLRFFFMLPFLFFIVLLRKNLKPVILDLVQRPVQWISWSFVGFVLFYAPLTFAASYGPGWLVAGTWQFTIVAGVLLGPLFYKTLQTQEGSVKVRNTIQLKSLSISLLILVGVAFIQLQKSNELSLGDIIVGVLPVILAAFAYPLGNRKMMEVCAGKMDTFQRIFGMTLASIPFWIILSIYGLMTVEKPSSDQILQSFIVAISSGVIATTLFFIATNSVKEHQGKLAAVEATQSTQVIFVLIGEVLILSTPIPSGMEIFGLLIIIIGMLLHSYVTVKGSARTEVTMVHSHNKARTYN